MGTTSADDIAELQALLQECCDQLNLTPEGLFQVAEGAVPPDRAQPSVPGATNPGAASAEDILSGDAGPRWRPLVVGLPPGVSEVLSLVNPPLQVIVALLQLLSALLDIIKALLIGITDPFAALILAAYHALQAIINDLLNTGAYMYYDAPGFTSHDVSMAELGLTVEPEKLFHAGMRDDAAPPFPLDGFERWAGRFQASFDDPGDDARPILSDGASVEAVFIVAAAPTLEHLAQLIWLLGNLLNIDAFKRAWEKFVKDSDDPAVARLAQQSVAPDWKSVKLPELLPPLRHLARVPEILLGVMMKVQGVLDLIKDLADAIQEKVQVLLEIAEMIQEVIDLLDALQSAGLYMLPVATNEGVEGLKQAFVQATNRPDGGYVAGVCFLAAGPGLADAAFLWEIFTGGAFEKAGEEAWGLVEEAGEDIEDAAEEFGESAEDAYNEMVDAVESLPQDTLDSLGALRDDIVDAARNAPGELYEILDEAKEVHVDDAIKKGRERARRVQRRGERSLAMYKGANSAPPRDRVSPEDAAYLPHFEEEGE